MTRIKIDAARKFFADSIAQCNSIEVESDRQCIFFLTFIVNHLIYESHCDFPKSQNL